MRALRLLLLVDALGMAAASTVSDPILGSVALAPTLLVCILAGIASLSADLVRPRRRLDVTCSALSIVAPFPFLVLGHTWGALAGAVALATLQVLPLARGGWRGRGAELGGPRRVLAMLTLSTLVLLLAVVALVWYGARYLVPQPKGVWARAPYLVRLTTDAAAFRWELRDGEPSATIRVLGADGRSVTASDGRLSGLRPGTRYQWTADVGGEAAAAGAFRTAPETTGGDITIVSFGDYGSGNVHEYAIGRLAAAAQPSLFLSGGDNSYLLAAPPFLNRAIFTPLRSLLGEAASVIALGEHDLAWNGGSAVKSAFGMPGERYAVQYGPVQVTVLGLEADGSALDFARRTVGQGCSPACPVRLVLVHRPVDADNPIMPLLRRRHVAAILAAHLHRYERHVRAGVLELTVGTGGEGPGGKQFTKATPDAIVSLLDYGFLQIDIHGATIDYRFIDETGRVRDSVRRPVARNGSVAPSAHWRTRPQGVAGASS
jgi:hypothetical protein